MTTSEAVGRIRVKLVRSTIGVLSKHKACVRGLGLRRINDVSLVEDTVANRGMVRKVGYLLQVEDVVS